LWKYEGSEATDDLVAGYVGFVYLITNRANGMRYIGKKSLTRIKTRQVKGKKKRERVESDWKTYWSSSDRLKLDVQLYGEHVFDREILRLCKTKSECSYYEAKYQFEHDVLLSDSWYNDWLSVRVRKAHMMGKKR
jgi:hypothetical protein